MDGSRQRDGCRQSQYPQCFKKYRDIKKSCVLAQTLHFFQLFGDAQEMGRYNERKRSFAPKVSSQVILSV